MRCQDRKTLAALERSTRELKDLQNEMEELNEEINELVAE